MLVSLKWLKELVDVPVPVTELVDRLDLTGTAVESAKNAGASLDGVFVGLIVAKEQHPEADRLWVTTVDVGADEPLQIVCGAQNFNAGDKVPVATVGAVLPNGMAIKKAKLRGVESRGMNCSARELDLGEDHDGLMILPADAPVGMPFAEYAGLSDTILELEITPNRPDCLSVVGVAREVGAVFDRIASTPASTPTESGAPVAESVVVTIDDPEMCPRYTARLIRNVKIGPSPAWLAERVTASGTRSISNIVDITNYIMFELGQPLHAFDADLLGSDASGRIAIGVRTATDGERLTTLDDHDRVLTADTLLITDPTGPVALAGVMGGATTEVHDGTVNVLLESACFNPGSISRTSRRLGLFSEASSRFEKAVDRAGCVAALDRAAALMAELCGGEVAPGVIDTYPAPASERELTLRISRLNALLGTEIAATEASAILTRLGCTVSGSGDDLSVSVPTYRPDLEREIDLVEEVLRIHGMERVPVTLPTGAGRLGELTRDQRWRERIGATLRASGLNETMTYSFADPADTERLRDSLEEGEVYCELHNPMSAEQSVLRRSVLPGLLRSVSYNQRRGVEDVHLYEIGSTFRMAPGRKQPKERSVVAGVIAGAWHRPAWNEAAEPLGFFDGKGIIEALAADLGLKRFKVRGAELPFLQPGRAAEVLVGGEVVGWLGEVHPLVADAFEVAAPVTAFELTLAPLVRAAVDAKPFIDVPRFPAVELDVAIVVPEDVSAERIEQSIVSAGGKLLASVRLFDVYRGKGVPDGHKSMAFALAYRAADRTLTAEEVESIHDRLLRKVCGAVGGELRG
ncbi:MAG: phenylalanine--tRNA ligase subunit beta [Coriobacteriia bacterium]|nr:phenylalanine--tRNA ligase subunit beta [Coriobacteriia bacterium]